MMLLVYFFSVPLSFLNVTHFQAFNGLIFSIREFFLNDQAFLMQSTR